MNTRAVERLAALLHELVPTLYSGFLHDLAKEVVAAGWGHPDELTDGQALVIAYDYDHPTGPYSTIDCRAESFRAALAQANKGET